MTFFGLSGKLTATWLGRLRLCLLLLIILCMYLSRLVALAVACKLLRRNKAAWDDMAKRLAGLSPTSFCKTATDNEFGWHRCKS
ncbi:hypothetical protein BD626DRAFT_491260 [Schizophyllum amplum]|uniref:Uncharacterized protein n=1 Tax=Schizophyllum amplum TaxID=97359 RepID=A0A550BVM2_9AGAR|nr:hypothetical protein BD626DRAFT_518817 [Auriculariopsis ampla]TRM64259.1 hypothetical protein BD626DRAFT_491260 [Auriculariopsis ampla]